MRQHQKVLSTLPTTRNGTQGIKGEADTEADMPLPARNVRRGGAGVEEDEEGSGIGKGLTPRQRRAVERRSQRQREERGEEEQVAGPSSGEGLNNHTQTPSTKRKPAHSGGIPSNPGLLGGVPSAPKHFSLSANQKDKADRATVEQVLDSRTRAVLVSLIRRGLVGGVQGCVSTGKEANVYFAPGPENPPEEIGEGKSYPKPYPKDLALKIYKTSILSFKSRSQYIQGEHRFRNAYTKVANPRKMVKVWAEKELRNLRRLYEGGVRCPRVVDVRENVLVMEFLGSAPSIEEQGGQVLIASQPRSGDDDVNEDDSSDMLKNVKGQAGDQDEAESSRASKRLKDADVDLEELRELYAELLGAMRWMFRRCRLVHTDLSEYNIL
jgi:RIO kinase 1